MVNFSAVETFFTDKRPFFTENQGYFDLQHDLGTLFYTRRVGAALDDEAESACAELAHTLKGLSRERIAAELLEKTTLSGRATRHLFELAKNE